jgi:hypothetical protein
MSYSAVKKSNKMFSTISRDWYSNSKMRLKTNASGVSSDCVVAVTQLNGFNVSDVNSVSQLNFRHALSSTRTTAVAQFSTLTQSYAPAHYKIHFLFKNTINLCSNNMTFERSKENANNFNFMVSQPLV